MAAKLKDLVGDNFFRIGDSGPVVEAMQLALRDAGYGLKGTGYWANATDTALRSFQSRAGIKVDGVLGGGTAGALDMVTSVPVDSRAPSVVAEVSRPLWHQAGISLIGTKEGPGSRDNAIILKWAHDEGGEVAKNYTHDSIPWCALFQNHCLTLASLPGTGSLWALDFAGHWPSVKLDGPAVGAFAPMLRNGGGHIIQIAGRTRGGNPMGLGGNQSDAVNIEEFARARLNQHFWWPAHVPLPALIGWDHLPIVSSTGRISTNEA